MKTVVASEPEQFMVDPPPAAPQHLVARSIDPAYLTNSRHQQLAHGRRMKGIRTMTPVKFIQDLNDPDLTVEELQGIARRYQALVDGTGAGCVILSEDGRVLDANPQYVSFSGHTSLQEIVGRNVAEWTVADDREPFLHALEACLASGSLRALDVRYVGAGGRTLTVSFDATLEQVNGARRILALCRDNTAYKQAMASWEREKQYTETVFETAPFLLYEFDDQLRLIRWNKQLEQITGYAASELDHKPLFEWFASDVAPQIAEGLRIMRETGFAKVEALLRFKDGSQVPYYLSAARFDLDGREFFTGIGVDLSERKRAEESTKAERDRAKQYLQVAEVILILLDNDGKIELINRKGCEILGYEESELLGRNWFKLCLPALESDAVARAFKQIVAGNITPYEYFENPVVTKDGRQRLIAWHNSFMRDDLGHVTGILSSGEDITDRRQAEIDLWQEREALLQTHARLEATLNALPDLLFEVNENSVVTDFRAPRPELLYVSPDQFLGKKMTDVLPEEAASIIAAAISEADRTGSHRGGTYSLSMQHEVRWFELSISKKTPPAAERSFVMLARDITDRRRAEDELARANEQLTIERETLRNKNVALQELVDQIGESRKSTGAQIQSNIEKIVLPILDRLTNRLDAPGKRLLSLAETSLRDIVSPYVTSLETKSRKLTLREIELCEFIRRGMGSKEIASIRGCSVQTVIKQRKLVRKKLGIAGKEINLQAFVSNLALAPGPKSHPKE